MIYLNGHITVAFGDGYENILSDVVSVSVKNSMENIAASCTIICPLNARIAKDGGDPLVAPKRYRFVAGEKVRVQAWYDGYDKRTVFEGYVSQFKEGTPCSIYCEDQAYLLRKTVINKTWKATTLPQVLQYVCDQCGLKLAASPVDMDLKKGFFITNTSAFHALQQIKNDCRLNVWFSPEGMCVSLGKAQPQTLSVELRSNTNVIGCNIQQPQGVWNLFNVKIDYKDDLGRKKTYSYGNTEGKVKRSNFPSEEEAKKWAPEVLEELQRGEYEGTVTTLLYPVVNMLDTVNYTDLSYSARSGRYRVKGVDISLSTSGFRQVLTLSMMRQNINDKEIDEDEQQ